MEYVEVKQRERGLKLSRGVATSLQIFEWLSIVLITWAALFHKIDYFVSIVPNLALLIKIVGYALVVLIIVAGSLIADFLKWTQLSAMLNFFHIKNYMSGGLLTILFVFVAYEFIISEQEMLTSIGKDFASVAKDTSKYTDDQNYSLRLAEKQQVEKEYNDSKKRIENSVCAECSTIKAKYAKEIAIWSKKKAKTANDQLYIVRNISNLEKDRDSEISAAYAAFSAEKAKKLELLDSNFNESLKDVKVSLQSITTRIDSAKNKNDLEIAEREKKIKYAATGTAWITVILQLLCRLSSFFDLKKLNRLNELFDENNPLLDFLQTLPLIGKYFEDNFWVEMFTNKKAQREADRIKYEMFNHHNSEMKIRRQSKYMSFLKKHNYSDNILTNLYFSFFVWKAEVDEEAFNNMKSAYVDKKENPYSYHIPTTSTTQNHDEIDEPEEEKNLENFDENIENTGEKAVILDIITAFEMAKNFAQTDSEVEEISNIIEAFQMALNFITE